MIIPHPPLELLHYLFWGGCLMTALVALDLLFFCASHKRFFLGLVVATLSIISLAAFHVSDTYTGAGINEATWYHMVNGREGITWGMVVPIAQGLFFCFSALVVLAWLSWKRMRARRRTAVPGRRSAAWIAPYVLAIVSSPGLVQAADLMLMEINQDDYQAELARRMASIQTLQPIAKPKSVVYIYGESLEATFLDEQAFPGLTPNLNRLRRQAISLEGQRQAPFTSWTIAGIIASQCAFPAIGNQEHKEHSSSGDMVCLGDLLHDQGYVLNYFNGADLSFTGKALFFQTHQFDLAEGKQELEKRLPGVKTSDWGVRDEDLFKVVLQRFDELAADDKPFFLNALTVDTHPPKGYPSDVCQSMPYGDGKNEMLNAVHCSDYQIGKLVDTILSSGREDVIVIVASDHLQSAAGSAAKEDLSLASNRHNLWMALGTGLKPQRIQREGTTFDITPTLLSLMGYDVPAMNLGRDLLRPAPSLTEEFGEQYFFDRVASAFARGEDGRFRQRMANPSPKKPGRQ